MGEKVLITGGAGYIGSILVEYFLKENYEVYVVDNLLFNQQSLNNYFYSNKFNFINSDVRDYERYKDILKSSDVIIPLAAYVGAPICNKDKITSHQVNHDAILETIEKISKNQLLIMPTTNSAYGTGDKDNMCDEKSPLNPISDYAIQKVEIEKKLMQLENAISLRLATVFGTSPRMRMDLLVNDFTAKAFFDGYITLFESKFKRNYIHIRDVSRVIIHCLSNFEKMKGNIYNVGLSSANLSKKELCLKIQNHLPKFVINENTFQKDPDQRNYIVSNVKLENTGFIPKYDIDHGISELIKFYTSIKKYTFGNV